MFSFEYIRCAKFNGNMSTSSLEIIYDKCATSRIEEVDFQNIEFGKIYSDHMFTVDYKDGEWKNPVVGPYRQLSFNPSTSVLHYGQSIFEGLKAYRSKSGEIRLFRAEDNARRFNQSAIRMCMPEIPVDLFMQGLRELVKLDSNWIPKEPGSSLYVRPFMIATDEYIGVRPSSTYKFIIFTCPVGAYYTEPLRVKIELEYSRSANGGCGYAKAAGNYAGALYPAKLANNAGYHQLIWTDSSTHEYIEESGTMNILFMINGVLYSPAPSGTILDGITRRSVVEVAKSWGVPYKKGPISVKMIEDALRKGEVEEAFGAGTAATIAQIHTIGHDGIDYELPPIEKRKFSNKVYNFLENLKRGEEKDSFGWVEVIN